MLVEIFKNFKLKMLSDMTLLKILGSRMLSETFNIS